MIPQRSNAKSLDRWWCRCDDSHGIENRRQPRSLERFFHRDVGKIAKKYVATIINNLPFLLRSAFPNFYQSKRSPFVVSFHFLRILFLFHYYCFIEKRGINNTFFILFYEEFLKIDDGTIGLECRRINCSVNREIHR